MGGQGQWVVIGVNTYMVKAEPPSKYLYLEQCNEVGVDLNNTGSLNQYILSDAQHINNSMNNSLGNTLKKYQSIYHPVVPFDISKDHLVEMDFTEKNLDLNADILDNTAKFTGYISEKLRHAKAKYGIGGYAEHRTVYSRSRVFDAEKPGGEPRRVHLGVDIWGEEETPVFAPMGGMIHSFAFNDHYGDYGATIIVLHQLDGLPFYTLYGHLSLRDIDHLSAGQYVVRGEEIAHFGNPNENGHWPPHLHFQVILDMELYEGDYPGVCRYSEKEKYLSNCPDPDLILQLNQFIK